MFDISCGDPAQRSVEPGAWTDDQFKFVVRSALGSGGLLSWAPEIKQQLCRALLPQSVYREIVRKHPTSQRHKSNDAADERR